MKEYHKINTCWMRDQKGNIIEGQWSDPVFGYLANNEWVFTEKVDGTNIRAYWDGNRVTFGGRTDAASIPTFLLNRLNDLFDTTPKRQKFSEVFGQDHACLYGEGYGAKIQKGGGNYKADGVDFTLFDVAVGDWWLMRKDVEDVAAKLGCDIVPILGNGTLHDGIARTRNGFNSTWGDFIAEGIVARPVVEFKTRKGERVITKIKHRDFKFLGATVAA